MRRRLTYPHVVSTLALIVALGGTSYAAIKLPANSVGSKQIKAGAVKNAEIERGALALSRLSDAALRELLAEGSIKTKTVQAPLGPPSCPSGGCNATIPEGTQMTSTVACPTGMTVLSGGFLVGQGSESAASVTSNGPTDTGTGWAVTFRLNRDYNFPVYGSARAVCGAPALYTGNTIG